MNLPPFSKSFLVGIRDLEKKKFAEKNQSSKISSDCSFNSEVYIDGAIVVFCSNVNIVNSTSCVQSNTVSAFF
jgi:hypothetical protein